jgi:hypothetical protein
LILSKASCTAFSVPGSTLIMMNPFNQTAS